MVSREIHQQLIQNFIADVQAKRAALDLKKIGFTDRYFSLSDFDKGLNASLSDIQSYLFSKALLQEYDAWEVSYIEKKIKNLLRILIKYNRTEFNSLVLQNFCNDVLQKSIRLVIQLPVAPEYPKAKEEPSKYVASSTTHEINEVLKFITQQRKKISINLAKEKKESDDALRIIKNKALLKHEPELKKIAEAMHQIIALRSKDESKFASEIKDIQGQMDVIAEKIGKLKYSYLVVEEAIKDLEYTKNHASEKIATTEYEYTDCGIQMGYNSCGGCRHDHKIEKIVIQSIPDEAARSSASTQLDKLYPELIKAKANLPMDKITPFEQELEQLKSQLFRIQQELKQHEEPKKLIVNLINKKITTARAGDEHIIFREHALHDLLYSSYLFTACAEIYVLLDAAQQNIVANLLVELKFKNFPEVLSPKEKLLKEKLEKLLAHEHKNDAGDTLSPVLMVPSAPLMTSVEPSAPPLVEEQIEGVPSSSLINGPGYTAAPPIIPVVEENEEQPGLQQLSEQAFIDNMSARLLRLNVGGDHPVLSSASNNKTKQDEPKKIVMNAL